MVVSLTGAEALNRTHFAKRLRLRLKDFELIERANGMVKGRLQELQAQRIQRDYEARARSSGATLLTGEALATALRAKLAPRRGATVPRGCGDLHVFVMYPGDTWAAVLPSSLAPFGQVTPYDYVARGFVRDRSPAWLERRARLDTDLLAAFDAAQALRPVDAVVMYTSGAFNSRETIAALGARGAAIFNFCWDDKLEWPGDIVGGRFEGPAEIAGEVDLNLTNAPSSIVKYAMHGGLAMFWPEAGLPSLHRPYECEFEFDVSFVGARYGWRPRFIAQLERSGIRVACFGRGWPRGALSDEEMVRLYSRSRINLGFAGIGHSRRLMCLKGRDFEVPMSGGLYLTQDNPELSLVYAIGDEIVTYRDADDCARTIRSLLADPQRCAQIRRAGRARSLRDHSYEARWSQIFRMAGILG